MNPFSEFSIQPAFGLSQAVISWKLADGVSGNVYFYRSESGTPGSWQILNPDDPATGATGDFLDTTASVGSLITTYYRGMVDGGGAPDTWLKGPPITALDSTTRREFCITREIMRREYLAMLRHSGLPALHYIPRTFGVEAPHTDVETGQILGPDCPGALDSGYGTLWQGGFHTPVQTWVRLLQLGDEDHRTRQDATGDDPSADVMFRLLAFPKPMKGHVIVLTKSDRRYVIKDPVKRFFLRGNVPVAWEAQAELLDRDDGRYRMPIPVPLVE